ncbi:MAG: CpsD/CapB family tyrosine-protein kinase [Candidatus Omnitrophota bacterium]
MGKITDALKKVADERIARIQKKPETQYVIRKINDTAINEHIVSFHDPSSPIGEQYKILRTNIQTLRLTNNYKTFVVTSAINSEGKTVTSINLAITMAHDLNGKSVLIIDADMRKGAAAKYFGINRSPGLSEILKDEAGIDAVFVNPGIDNLTVMPAGKTPRNPSELLNSKKMETLLNMLKPRFDYIFIDSPPVMPLTDACILGPLADGVILVIQAGRTQSDIVKHAETRLQQSRAKILGYVMTNVEYHMPQYLYKYINKYESYYYHEKQPVKAKEMEVVS